MGAAHRVVGSRPAGDGGPRRSCILAGGGMRVAYQAGALKALLDGSSDHWGFEDPVYRFYHHSFKVFWLQQQTGTIVQRLSDLLPDRPLHPWFLEIVRQGTGQEFAISDNDRWTFVTRPIVEAFFHARFFLEMAVRYAKLETPPRPLPSGYAALLYLFQLR